ncbi:hypothetical protein CN692_12610 [Bacillus sp. AFS002410]|uniref:DUF2243 domain-containing protein n=1 Tax=Bacillus sp. AFS002410 TaxID=2033481 RepID=UPI000BF21E67|nr:DUF2243 domain-containing protein [Bacillus sp. AFS002410]PEJ57513.1 hypothetical protein CN692_12610 [Bacillus sp. AFS002410]
MTIQTNTSNHYLHLNLYSGVLFGLGLVAFFDEVVFHQLLHWHHFYDKSTTSVGLVSDGLFHAFSWFATIASLFLFANLRRKKALYLKRWFGGLLLGAGIFQLYDGTVQHKWLKLHQIRYNVDPLPYDLTWNITATVMTLIGIILLFKTRNRSGQIEQ